MDTISIGKITKGNNYTKKQVEQLLLISARRLVMLYISTKFSEIISNGIKVIELYSGHHFLTENNKGE